MPRIREYTNQANIDPSVVASTGREVGAAYARAGASLGAGLQGIGAGVQAVQQHMARAETSKLAADMATAQAELTVEWNKTVQSADPNDTEVGPRFLRDVAQPRLDKIGEGLESEDAQNMFTRASAALNADLVQKTSADQMHLAGVATVANMNTVKNQLTQSARADPTSFENLIAMADLTIEGAVKQHDLPEEAAIQLQQQTREEIAVGAFLGMADANPTAAKAELASGKFDRYFDASKSKTLEAYADAQERAQTEQQRAAEVEQRRVQKDQADTISSAISASLINPETNQMVVPQDYFTNVIKYAQLPGADAGTVRAMTTMGQSVLDRQAKGQPDQTDPHIYSDFANRMFLPPNDPRQLSSKEIFMAKARAELSDKDFNFFQHAIYNAAKNPQQTAAAKDFNAFLGSLKGFITKSNMLQTFPAQDQRYYEFQSDARVLFEQMSREGKSKADIQAAVKNLIPKYQVSTKQGLDMLQTQVEGNPQPLPPVPHGPARLPNESPEAYLKRTGG